MRWWVKCLKNYSKFSGRARRKEYWMFFLVQLVILYGLGFIIESTKETNEEVSATIRAVFALYFWATFLPMLPVSVRRLHDIGKSGWTLLISFIPIIGGIIQIAWLASPGVAGENKYGTNPITD